MSLLRMYLQFEFLIKLDVIIHSTGRLKVVWSFIVPCKHLCYTPLHPISRISQTGIYPQTLSNQAPPTRTNEAASNRGLEASTTCARVRRGHKFRPNSTGLVSLSTRLYGTRHGVDVKKKIPVDDTE